MVGLGNQGSQSQPAASGVQGRSFRNDTSDKASPGATETRMEDSLTSLMLADKSILHGVLGTTKPVD